MTSCKTKSLRREDIVEIEIDLTGVCNLKCPLCTRNFKHAESLIKANSRSVEEIKAQLDTFPNLQIMYIAGLISEPTLYKDFHELCRYLAKRKIRMEIFTNGSTHHENWWANLGEILTHQDRLYFTICGSTQELHEKYRVGSSLEMILRNHQAFISTNKLGVDQIQHILFRYNREDFDSEPMKEIIGRFSGAKLVETEGRRSINEYIKQFDKENIRPENERERIINSLFDIRPKPDDGKSYEIKCESLRDRKVYIDQFGRISPCYGHAEFAGPGHFNGEVFDYKEVLSFKFHDCFKCEKRIQKLTQVMGIEFVC